MVNIKLNERPTECPTSYHELTAGTFQRIFKEWDMDKEVYERDFFKLFCILTNSSFVSLDQSDENETALFELTRWVIEQPIQFKEQDSITIDGKTIDIPKKVGALSIGQNIVLRQLIQKSKYLEENISIATAIYLQPLYSGGKFDYGKAKELDKIIQDMPVKDVYSVGFFLQRHVLKDGQRRISNLHLIQSSLNRLSRRMLPRWLRSPVLKGLVISR